MIVNTLNNYTSRAVYDTYAENIYHGRHFKIFNLQFKAFFKQHLKEIELPNLLTEWKATLMKILISKIKKPPKPPEKQINLYYSRKYWSKSISHEFMWFLFQDILSYTANNMINHSNNPILQSIIKVFSFFMVQYQYEYDEVIGMCIQCNN